MCRYLKEGNFSIDSITQKKSLDDRLHRQLRFEDDVLTKVLSGLGVSSKQLYSIKMSIGSGNEYGFLNTEWFNSEVNFPVALMCVAPPSERSLQSDLLKLFKSSKGTANTFLIRNIRECEESFPGVESALITNISGISDRIVVHTLDIGLHADNEAYIAKRVDGKVYRVHPFKQWLKHFIGLNISPLDSMIF